jgi:hypothetical protein
LQLDLLKEVLRKWHLTRQMYYLGIIFFGGTSGTLALAGQRINIKR